MVIEKDAVFHRLLEDLLPSLVPCIVLTARGFPDIGTRTMLHRLASTFPVPVVGLVDWNPSGVAILRQYKLGGRKQNLTGREGMELAVPNLHWLGIRAAHLGIRLNFQEEVYAVTDELGNVLHDVRAVPQATGCERLPGLQDLSDRDRALIRGLMNDPSLMEWHDELGLMELSGKKAEVELVYDLVGIRNFAPFIASLLVNHDFI